VVGGNGVAQAPAYDELQRLHGELLQALRSRSPKLRAIARVVRAKAKLVSPELPEFYRRLARRADHFRAEAALSEQRSDG
jgi:adenylate cyclase